MAERIPTCRGPLQGAHIKPAGSNPGLRFELDNGVILCSWHHIWGPEAWHRDPDAAIRWCRKNLGQPLLDHLNTLAAIRKGARCKTDREAMRLYLLSEIERRTAGVHTEMIGCAEGSRSRGARRA